LRINRGRINVVTIQEIKAKSILLKHGKIDSWFVSRYGMNLYRGCTHSCVYCDGRSERYRVDGVFGENVAVKTNAVEVLRRELKPIGRRVKLKPGFIMLGGGVGDSYQPIDEKYQLTRKTLQLLCEYRWPVHILTKSTLVERDIDIIKRINQQNRAIVSFSFSSANDAVSAIFEPHVPSPSERLKTLATFKKEGVACGMFLLPVIPFITDTPEMIGETLKKARDVGVDFVIFGGMTLKAGRQKDYFYNVLSEKHPELIAKYEEIYEANEWGQATDAYYSSINSVFNQIAKMYKLHRRMPPALYRDLLWENDLVVVMLEQLDYFLRLEGKRSSFGYAAYAISKLNTPLSAMKNRLREISGVGEKTEQIILEILETKGSAYYDSLS
jgi:DNA repair photolyase